MNNRSAGNVCESIHKLGLRVMWTELYEKYFTGNLDTCVQSVRLPGIWTTLYEKNVYGECTHKNNFNCIVSKNMCYSVFI